MAPPSDGAECGRRRRVVEQRGRGTMIDARKIARYGEDVWLGQVCSDESGSAAGDKSESTSPMPPWISPVRYAKWVPATKRLHVCASAITPLSPPSCTRVAVKPLPQGSISASFFDVLPNLQKGFSLHPTHWSLQSALNSKNVATTAAHLQENSYVTLRNLLSDGALRLAAEFAHTIVRSGALPQHDAMTARHHFVNDTLSRFLQVELTPLVERLAGVGPLTLSHTYFAGYVVAGARVPHHRDRPGCDMSLSLNVVSKPQRPAFPIGVSLPFNADAEKDDMYTRDDDAIIGYEFGANGWQEVRQDTPATGKSAGKNHRSAKIVEVLLDPGDAFLFWGRKLEHFRRHPLPVGAQSLNLLLHWSRGS